MKNEIYYVGLDIGTDSVGYAVTDERYNLCKFKGEPMWGTTLFEATNSAEERRGYRTARRRLDRRQQRVKLLQELFAAEIAKTDHDFFRRIAESYKYPQSEDERIRLFGTYEAQKQYADSYPTIHHLISELMYSTEPHDVRLVYIACAWLTVHRGHFLSDVETDNVDNVTDFNRVYTELTDFLKRDGDPLPWSESIDTKAVADALKQRCGIQKKNQALTCALFENGKAPKEIDTDKGLKYNYACVTKLLSGGSAKLKDIFESDYAELENQSVCLGDNDETLAATMRDIDEEDAELIRKLKSVYDWSVLVDILNGEKTISEAKVKIYEQHQKDLANLKLIVKTYRHTDYNAIFRNYQKNGNDNKTPANYPAYIGTAKTGEKVSLKKKSQEDFCEYVLPFVKDIPVMRDLEEMYADMIARLKDGTFMPKQVNGDNRVIPHQLYLYELKKILDNAKAYLPFLQDADGDGLTVAEKISMIFTFRVPYYVGPLKKNPDNRKKLNHWLERKAEGKIYPWNFDKLVDHDKCEQAFIERMTNTCTYLAGKDVLPKNSILYCYFDVLNEINSIKINGVGITVEQKQKIVTEHFEKKIRVGYKDIKGYLISNNIMTDGDKLEGIDETVKASLKPYVQFKNLIDSGSLTCADAEKIIKRATYSEDKTRYKKWLAEQYSQLSEKDMHYVSGLSFKEFGRLSKELLCGIEGTDKTTGETFTVIRALWETNYNFMQLMSEQFTFKDEIDRLNREYYDANPKSLSERLDEMYVSNAVKRPIIRTLDILNDIVKVQGKEPPKAIFIEMARGADGKQKGRTSTRLERLKEYYKKIDTEEVRELNQRLDEWGDAVHNKLQGDKLYLYFLQLGKCLYTGDPIDINSLIADNGRYNIEHIYPQSAVKDDSIFNNEILVESEANGRKSDTYPVSREIQSKMRGYWEKLHKNGLMTDEKFKRLTRTTALTDDEKLEFINRQLVETRQSTKVLAELLKEQYPDTEIVYVKAGLVSDFRQEFGLLKSRSVNDLHHAKDAYLNIVAGNVWHCKFSKKFWQTTVNKNPKIKVVFENPVKDGNRVIWEGAADKERAKSIARKNTAHLTVYSYCKKGGFFDQMPLGKDKDLFPRKKDMPPEIYGGYNKTAATFFVLTRYAVGKKRDVMLMPVELLCAKKFLSDKAFALEYARETVAKIWKKPVSDVHDVEFLLNGRPLKIRTVLSLDGLRVCITGKSGQKVTLSILTAFKTNLDTELYIKKLESFDAKRGKNSNIVYDEAYDKISKAKNLELYDVYIEKFKQAPYNKRPANPIETLEKGRQKFEMLNVYEQVGILLQIQGLFGRANSADLEKLKPEKNKKTKKGDQTGVAAISLKVSNWNYKDVRIIDTSASGLYEKRSENLLDLL